MKTLEMLISEEAAAANAFAMAKKQHAVSLQALYKPLQDLCERYETLFKPIQDAAESFALAVPELDPDHPPSENRWGNHGLNRLVSLPGGFTEIHTNDHFRNEWDVFQAVLPSKYLGDDGIPLMERDAKRIQGEIAALKAANSIEPAASPGFTPR